MILVAKKNNLSRKAKSEDLRKTECRLSLMGEERLESRRRGSNQNKVQVLPDRSLKEEETEVKLLDHRGFGHGWRQRT